MADAAPSVSVCLPAFDGARHIGEAIGSVRAQTFEDFELVVVDNASSDVTADVVATCGDPRVRLTRHAMPLGRIGAWNRCLDLARGRHVALFHPDDVMAPDNLRAKLAFLDAHPSAELVYSSAADIGLAGEVLEASPAGAPIEGLEVGPRCFRRLVEGQRIPASSVVARRSTLERLGGFDPRVPCAADLEMWLRLVLCGDAGFLAAPLVRCRRRSASCSPARDLEQTYLATTLAMDKHPDRVPGLDAWRRRVAESCRDEAMVCARAALAAGQAGLAGEFVRVALIAGQGLTADDGAASARRIVGALGVGGGAGVATAAREIPAATPGAPARLDELRRAVDERERVIRAMVGTRVWRAAQTWWSVKQSARGAIERGAAAVGAASSDRAAAQHDVTIYCPDRHFVYDGRTPDRQGVGGGLTARVRLARALAALGHRVTVVANCRREGTFDRVRYVPLEAATQIRADVLVLNTSGGGLDLSPIFAVDVRADCRILWLQGHEPPPPLLHEVPFDFLCTPSNFVRRVALREWNLPPSAMFVAYNAADPAPVSRWSLRPRPARDPYRLVYMSHPDKGLAAAIGVLRELRRRDRRYHLHVYGSARLSGQAEGAPPVEEGLTFHGVVGQAYLARALLGAGISLNLQAREEPLPLAAVEAMRAGCIVLASPVGGYPEIVRHGENGFLVPGDHRDEATWRHAADLVCHLAVEPTHARYLRHNAGRIPWSWTTMAWTWSGFWEWALGRAAGRPHAIAATHLSCAECGGTYLALADGYHCTGCGFYRP